MEYFGLAEGVVYLHTRISTYIYISCMLYNYINYAMLRKHVSLHIVFLPLQM